MALLSKCAPYHLLHGYMANTVLCCRIFGALFRNDCAPRKMIIYGNKYSPRSVDRRKEEMMKDGCT
jgi:hypothetical protein